MSACPVPDGRPGLRMLALAAVLLSGCSTSDVPKELGGLPADAPQRPAQLPAYPGVFDKPPPRSSALLDAEQQKKLEADLTAIRNRQSKPQKNASKDAKAGAKAKADKAKAERAKTAKRPQGEAAPQQGAPSQAASGTPPWPVPPQTTGGSARP
jgi:hypothetical protein